MFQLENADQAVKKYLKLALYGPPGTGKTHVALTFPDVVVIDTEAGTDFFRGRVAPFRVLKTKDFAQTLEVVTAIEDKKLMAGTLVIDSFTVLNDVLRESAFRAAEKRAIAKGMAADDYTVTPRDWGKIKAKMNSLMTRLYNLPCHTIFTGWIKDQYEGEGNELKKIGTGIDADKKSLYQPDLVLELAFVKGKHIAYVKKDRTGTWGLDSRLVDISYAATFAPLVETISQGTAETAGMVDEETAAERGSDLFDSRAPGIAALHTIFEQIGLSDPDALWLLSSKLKKPIAAFSDIPAAKMSDLITSLQQTDAHVLRNWVADHREVAHV